MYVSLVYPPAAYLAKQVTYNKSIHTFAPHTFIQMMRILRADRFSQISNSGRETDSIAT